MNITPAKVVELEYRAYFLCAFPGRSLFAIAAKQGVISLSDPSTKESTVRLLPGDFGEIQAIAAHPSELHLALIESGILVIVDLDGQRHFQESARSETGEEVPFVACAYDPVEPYLWCVVRLSPGSVEIELRDQDGKLLSWHEQEDPYSESSCSLHPNTPNAGVALWLAAGQDGQQIYWLTRSPEGILCRMEPALEDTTPPVFSPSGNEFLVLGGDAVHRYAYPSLELFGTFDSPWEDTALGMSLCYLDTNRALLMSMEQCLFVLDLDEETLTEEAIIAGHEPQPTPVYYPSLTNESELCTDITGFERFGDWIIAQFRRSATDRSSDWQDTLLCFSTPFNQK